MTYMHFHLEYSIIIDRFVNFLIRAVLFHLSLCSFALLHPAVVLLRTLLIMST